MRQPARDRLLRILRTQSQSRKTQRMRGVMREMLEEAGMQVRVENKQLFARKGNALHMPVIVAHADTVHALVPEERYRVGFDVKDGQIIHHAYDPKTNKPRGVGGDDKCGLWIAQEIARNMDNVGVIITVDEEIGCVGARRVTKEQLAHATVLIQADRRGKDDAVTRASGINISSDDWQAHVKRNIEDHGYRYYTFGAGTDVAAMHNTNAAEVSAINLSAAYFEPHTDREYVAEDHLENAFELALKLAEVSSDERWMHEAKRHVYTNTTTTYHGNSYLNAQWFDNSYASIQAGWHATHLVRDAIKNSPRHPKWYWDNDEKTWISKDKQYITVHCLGGVVMYPMEDFREVAQRIRKSGFECKQFLKTDHAHISQYLREFITDDIKEKRTMCNIDADCQNEAHVFHMIHLRWMCDEHADEVMTLRGENYLSERPNVVTSIPEHRHLSLPWGVDNQNHLGYD